MLLIVGKISEDFISGTVGPIEVMIPRSRIAEKCSKYQDGDMILQTQEVSRVLRKGDILLARCFEVREDMGRLKVVASIEGSMLDLVLKKRYEDR